MTAPSTARVFPNDRLSYRYDSTTDRIGSGAGAKVWMFEDEDMAVPATIRFYPGGQEIPGAMIVVGPDSLIPEFLETSGRNLDVLWALTENSTTPYRMDARLADRMIAVEAVAATSVGMGGRNFYRHDQLVPAASWPVVHTLVRLPTVTVIVGGEEVDTDIYYPSATEILAVFPEPTAGTLICT